MCPASTTFPSLGICPSEVALGLKTGPSLLVETPPPCAALTPVATATCHTAPAAQRQAEVRRAKGQELPLHGGGLVPFIP